MTRGDPVLECVLNISEARDPVAVSEIAAAAGDHLLDIHSDVDHNRSVLTIAGGGDGTAEAARSVAREAVERLDIGRHQGVHPRIGAVDVVPFVSLNGWPLLDGPLGPALDARDRFARWLGTDLGVPCFLYGPERTLPEVRREAWGALAPDTGPRRPHPTAGAAAVGARPSLVAYNLWLGQPDLALARRIAAEIRGPQVRTLAFPVGEEIQVSCNLIAPMQVGPAAVYDAVASRAGVDRAELVGLVPSAVLDAVPRHRWRELGLAASTTIEARLEQAGLDGGSVGAHRE